MKQLPIEEKAKRYDEAIKEAVIAHKDEDKHLKATLERIFPELKEDEDERIRKELLEHCKNQAKPYIQTGNKCPQIQSWIDWLEKKGKQKETLFDKCKKAQHSHSCQDMTTLGRCTLEKQGEKSNWNTEDKFKVQRVCKYLDEAKKYYADITEVRECMDWLKSLEDRYAWKPSNEQMEALANALSLAKNCGEESTFDLRTLYEQLKKLKK